MDLSRYVDDLQHRLATAAQAGGEDARELAERLTAPLDAAVRLVLLDALAAAAGEISAELAPGSVDVRLRAGEPEFVVAPAPAEPVAPTTTYLAPPVDAVRPSAAPAPPSAASLPEAPDVDAGATTRTTLRLPDHLKAQVEAAAAREGVSVNTWLVRAVSTALEQPAPARPGPPAGQPQRGNRLTGWVR